MARAARSRSRSSSVAASASSTNGEIVSSVAGRISIPPVVPSSGGVDTQTGCATPFLLRRGSPRTGPVVLGVRPTSSPSAVTISAASRLSIVRPCFPDEVADAAAERKPADPDRACVPETKLRGHGRRPLRVTSPRRQSASARARAGRDRSRAASAARGRAPALADTVAGVAVAAASDRSSRPLSRANDAAADLGSDQANGRWQRAPSNIGRTPDAPVRTRRRRVDHAAGELGAGRAGMQRSNARS